METPLELLRNRLATLRFIASQRGFSKNKKEAALMKPLFETAISVLEACEGKADSTSEKDLRVCEVSNSLPLILGLDNPYPLRDVLERLKWATNYLLHEKNYDGHSYEELNQCVRRANEIIAMLNGNGC